MEPTSKLNEALAKAQAEMKNAPLNKTNPHFKSKYADLASIRDATVPALSKHGLSITQYTRIVDGSLVLITRLLHASGEFIESEYPLPMAVDRPQAMGSAYTYGKRYSWSALLGIAAEEDDDGNGAEAEKPAKPGSGVVKAARQGFADDRRERADNQPMMLGDEKPSTPPLWNGPLAPEELQQKLQDFCDDLGAVNDEGELAGLLNGYEAVLDQCKVDLPKWWNGSPDKPGIFQRIETRRTAVNTVLMAG